MDAAIDFLLSALWFSLMAIPFVFIPHEALALWRGTHCKVCGRRDEHVLYGECVDCRH